MTARDVKIESKAARASGRLATPKLILVAIALLGTFSSCSLRRLALENSQWLATRYAASYLDLDSPQKDTFQQQLVSFNARVRTVHLEAVISEIRKINELGDTNSGLSGGSDVDAIIDRLTLRFGLVAMDGCSAFAPLVATLSPEQIEHLRSKLREGNEKYDPQASGGIQSLRKDRLNNVREMAERWLGDLTSGQLAALEGSIIGNDPEGRWERDYLAYRTETQVTFLKIMADARGRPEIFAGPCRAFAENIQSFLSVMGRQTRDRMARRRRAMATTLIEAITPSQRARLKKETSQLIADIEEWRKSTEN